MDFICTQAHYILYTTHWPSVVQIYLPIFPVDVHAFTTASC